MATSSDNIIERRKKDALDLAFLIYDIFQEEELMSEAPNPKGNDDEQTDTSTGAL